MSHLNVSARSGRRLWAGALATTLLMPAPASAFFQQTKLEGTIGADIGGVWLSTHQMMPEFRVTYTKPKEGKAVPVAVGPVPADLEPVTGKNPDGVVITDCSGSNFCSENGLVVGDMIIRINANDVVDVATFEKALENLPPNVMLSVRRPALKMSSARLIKIRYEKEGKETSEGSVEEEKVDVKVLDVKLPFAAALEKTRQSHEYVHPSPSDLENLAKTWAELPQNAPLVLMSGNHRLVAKANFDEALAMDKSLANARYALLMDLAGNPTRGGGGKLIEVYGIETIDGSTMEGNIVSVTIASAPFPINVEFKGRFKMTRIAPWSDEDDKFRAKNSPQKPVEDLNKYKTLPDVPEPAKPADNK